MERPRVRLLLSADFLVVRPEQSFAAGEAHPVGLGFVRLLEGVGSKSQLEEEDAEGEDVRLDPPVSFRIVPSAG